ncbi:MAG: flippase-like domain-containing protein [Verrucomicrobiae bacterium]|nr:flippase-like domain-containing protein [Verrucomicrobiae bacterium]
MAWNLSGTLQMHQPIAVSPPGRRARAYLSWLGGAAACAALVFAVTHLSEEKEFIRLLEKVEPFWLGVAFLFQVGTYLVQGLVWRMMTGLAWQRLSLWRSFELSLAMLFVNQALPSAGISGIALVSGALRRAGMPPAVVASAVLVDQAMYYLAYSLCMAVAFAFAVHQRNLPGWVALSMLLFVIIGLGTVRFLVALPGGRMKGLKKAMRRLPKISHLLDLVGQSNPETFQTRSIRLRACACHVTIFLLDAGTIWVAARALGADPSVGGVFSSFMVSSLFRTIGIMPGGLGTFEAASVMSLKSIGLPLSVGLSATLLFRGLSFWVPMIPGLISSRRISARSRERQE